MTEARRQALFNGLAIALLLLGGGLGNSWLLVGGAVGLLVAGVVLLREQRVRGLSTAVVAIGASLGFSLLIHVLR